MIQCFSCGNGLGHNSSTSMRGACPPRPCAETVGATLGSATTALAASAPAATLNLTIRFIPLVLLLPADRPRGACLKTGQYTRTLTKRGGQGRRGGRGGQGKKGG